VKGNASKPYSSNSLPTLATKVAENGDKLSPETATNVAENGNKSRCFRQHLLPFLVTICLRFGQLLLPFSATIASATICRRFLQLLSPVWTGYNNAHTDLIGRCPSLLSLKNFSGYATGSGLYLVAPSIMHLIMYFSL